MQRINTSTRAIDLFGPGKDGFKDGDLGNGIVPTDLNAAWFNAAQEEVLAVIEAAGLTPDGGDLAQLLQALRLFTGGVFLGVQVFTPSGTYTPDPRAITIIAGGCGGGGGGGGAPNPGGTNMASVGGGGSAGAYGWGVFPAPSLPLAVTIGAGGTASVNGNGGNGGATSLGPLLTFPGGGGGVVSTASGTAQGAGAQGNASGSPTGANIFGVRGHQGQSGILLGGSYGRSGSGGDSPFGSGGDIINSSGTTGVAGRAAAGYGAGGGGGIVTGNNGASVAGGVGSGGLIIVIEFGWKL